jgi:adenosine deaminase
LEDGLKEFGISFKLVMCFLRDETTESAFETLEIARKYKDLIIGVGLDSNEIGYPPSLFQSVFKKAKEGNWFLVSK